MHCFFNCHLSIIRCLGKPLSHLPIKKCSFLHKKGISNYIQEMTNMITDKQSNSRPEHSGGKSDKSSARVTTNAHLILTSVVLNCGLLTIKVGYIKAYFIHPFNSTTIGNLIVQSAYLHNLRIFGWELKQRWIRIKCQFQPSYFVILLCLFTEALIINSS